MRLNGWQRLGIVAAAAWVVGSGIWAVTWFSSTSGYRGRDDSSKVAEGLLTGTIEEIAEKTQRIVTAIAPDAWCQEQEWDNRIDCGIKQPDGSVVFDMILLRDATESRIKESGERLLQRQKGIPVALPNEMPPAVRIIRSPQSN